MLAGLSYSADLHPHGRKTQVRPEINADEQKMPFSSSVSSAVKECGAWLSPASGLLTDAGWVCVKGATKLRWPWSQVRPKVRPLAAEARSPRLERLVPPNPAQVAGPGQPPDAASCASHRKLFLRQNRKEPHLHNRNN